MQQVYEGAAFAAAVESAVVEPRYRWVPPSVDTRGPECIEFARMAGLELDDWQQLCLIDALGVDEDDKWAAFEVGIDVARQNGKNAILEARELAGVFLFGERLLVHSAHLVDTSLEAMTRLLDRLEDSGLDNEVKRVARTNGREAIEFRNGARIRFRTRTKGGGRGFSADFVGFDEAMYIPEMVHGALLPVLSARPNPQVWYTGSAVDQEINENGLVFSRVRHRGLKGDTKGLVWIEWSANAELAPKPDTDEVPVEDVLADRAEWANANPALGIRITEEHVDLELAAMDRRTFAVERLGVGDWPRVDAVAQSKINPEQWLSLADEESVIRDPVCIALDVTPDRSRTAIVAAGLRDDDIVGVEVVEHRRGTGWVPERVRDLTVSNDVAVVCIDGRSPAAGLLRPLEELGVEVESVTAAQYTEACGLLFDLIEQAQIRHLGTAELTAAVKNAGTRPLGDAWAWSRKLSASDISPLVAATLAVWQASAALGSVYDDRGLVVI